MIHQKYFCTSTYVLKSILGTCVKIKPCHIYLIWRKISLKVILTIASKFGFWEESQLMTISTSNWHWLIWQRPQEWHWQRRCQKGQGDGRPDVTSGFSSSNTLQNLYKCITKVEQYSLFWSKRTLQLRVAEVAREHGWHPPKSLDSDKNFKPEHTLFCHELRFVAI